MIASAEHEDMLKEVRPGIVRLIDHFMETHCDEPCVVAFSGGADSALIARAAALRGITGVFLDSECGGRDRVVVKEAAEILGVEFTSICVTREDLLAAIEVHREWLVELPDYTQRILAVCELFLAQFAARKGCRLVTGHGPEAFLGGFHRHKAPDFSAPDLMRQRLAFNASRLDRVACAAGSSILLPFAMPEVIEELIALRRRGLDKSIFYSWLPPDFPRPSLKSSLQNGSGLHYLFARLAHEHGWKRVRDYMEHLVA